jgi:putative aldouronate transport system permease protein
MPTISVIFLYYAVAHWNAWFDATIFIHNVKLMPLQVFLRDILMNSDTNNETAQNAARGSAAVSESIKYATVMVSIVPVLCIYPGLQKYFTKGVMIGAVKG